MDSLQATYREIDDEVDESINPTTSEPPPGDNTAAEPLNDAKPEPMSSDFDDPPSSDTNKSPTSTPNSAANTNENDNDTTTTNTTNNNNDEVEGNEEDDEEDPPPKKQKPLSSLTTPPLILGKAAPMEAIPNPETVLITPIQNFPDRSDDTQDMKICLLKIYKAEKVELSDDRLSAGSTKGYMMVRATRGVVEGTWYFEIEVASLGESGHTRLGWSTEKGNLQAPVGYDEYSFGYRDIDESKVHKALREKYGEEGFPEGGLCRPKPSHLVLYKGQRYACAPDAKAEAPKVVPVISFFKNGIWQGVAFKDLCGSCYYPAASMYTLPNQPNCVVKFNFGLDFEFFPTDFNEHPVPRPMVEVPYHGFENRVENGVSTEKNH
ncbi:hypothetical protein CIPAW_13G157500 [Carya illinoinensis]|uniref:B30.2/SPRY domain-containing protein n=1 Tax=Carya illinoinensis TaxID=32201 RepID=A0A8T1NUK7_CARIL|nr:hypothetical protein CIPAW_13G157500 [Carya illinoinensis]